MLLSYFIRIGISTKKFLENAVTSTDARLFIFPLTLDYSKILVTFND